MEYSAVDERQQNKKAAVKEEERQKKNLKKKKKRRLFCFRENAIMYRLRVIRNKRRRWLMVMSVYERGETGRDDETWHKYLFLNRKTEFVVQ